jgi:hypothetical protein
MQRGGEQLDISGAWLEILIGFDAAYERKKRQPTRSFGETSASISAAKIEREVTVQNRTNLAADKAGYR